MNFEIIKITEENDMFKKETEKKEKPPDLERNRKTEKKNKIQKNKKSKVF